MRVQFSGLNNQQEAQYQNNSKHNKETVIVGAGAVSGAGLGAAAATKANVFRLGWTGFGSLGKSANNAFTGAVNLIGKQKCVAEATTLVLAIQKHAHKIPFAGEVIKTALGNRAVKGALIGASSIGALFFLGAESVAAYKYFIDKMQSSNKTST